MDEVVLRARSLTKVYRSFLGRGEARALDGLDLEIRRGEFFALLGPNGSGKTTTFKLALGFLLPTAGSVEVLGAHPRDPEKNRRLGYLPEETTLHRFLTGEETLEFYGRLFGVPRGEREKRTAELLRLVGLERDGRRLVREYSKGMARRIGLAQALFNDPDFLVLDEPTSGLDPVGAEEMKQMLLRLKDRGKTVLLSSHLLGDIENVCDRVGILVRGRLACQGRLAELLARRDRLELVLRGASREQIEAALAPLVSKGASLLSLGHPRASLEELFLNIIAGRTREPDGPEPNPPPSGPSGGCPPPTDQKRV